MRVEEKGIRLSKDETYLVGIFTNDFDLSSNSPVAKISTLDGSIIWQTQCPKNRFFAIDLTPSNQQFLVGGAVNASGTSRIASWVYFNTFNGTKSSNFVLIGESNQNLEI